jgi:hypothetical protein
MLVKFFKQPEPCIIVLLSLCGIQQAFKFEGIDPDIAVVGQE